MVPATQQGAEPLPLSVTPMPPERNTLTGLIYAPLCSTQSVWVSSGTLLPFSPLINLGFWVFFFFCWIRASKLGSWTARELLVSLWFSSRDFARGCWGSDLWVWGEDCESCWDTVEGLAPSVLHREIEAWHKGVSHAGSEQPCSKVIALPCHGFCGQNN